MLKRPRRASTVAPGRRAEPAVRGGTRAGGGDEDDVEAAHEEPERQEPEAAMGERLPRTSRRLRCASAGEAAVGRSNSAPGERHHGVEPRRRADEGARPADRVDGRQHPGQHRELAERPHRHRDAHGEAAPLGRRRAGDRAEDDRERGAREPEPDEEPGERERGPAPRLRHQHEAADVQRGAAEDRLARAVAIREPAGERLGGAPGEVLQRDREREISRVQPLSRVIGARNRPKVCRIPSETARVVAPATSITVGVRQSRRAAPFMRARIPGPLAARTPDGGVTPPRTRAGPPPRRTCAPGGASRSGRARSSGSDP